MASYLPASTSRKRPLREAGYSRQPTQSARLSDSSLDDSIYVFPNPASAPRSPTQNPDLAAYAEFTPSVISESIRLPRSRDGRRTSSTSPSPLTPLSPWEWAEHVPLEVEQIYRGDIERPDQWQIGMNQHIESVSTYSMDSVPAEVEIHTLRQCPHPPAHIPLLSFFISLLAIDDSTVCLLSQPSSDSALSACHKLPPPNSCLEEVDGEPHGIEKLLVRRGGSRIMRDALVSERELAPYSPLSPVPLLGLWNTVTILVANGRKALREVLHR